MDGFVKSSEPRNEPPSEPLNTKFSTPVTNVITTSTLARGVEISELEAVVAENVSAPNTNDMLKPPREFSANVPAPGSVASVTVPVPTKGGMAGAEAPMPRLSKSNVNVTGRPRVCSATGCSVAEWPAADGPLLN